MKLEVGEIVFVYGFIQSCENHDNHLNASGDKYEVICPAYNGTMAKIKSIDVDLTYLADRKQCRKIKKPYVIWVDLQKKIYRYQPPGIRSTKFKAIKEDINE